MGAQGHVKADWYPDPQGGSGVRWWDGDRWTEDVRAEHPRAGATPSDPPPSEGWGQSRLVVSQVRPRKVGGPAYLFHDTHGLLLGTMVERPPVEGRRGPRAATLDLFDEDGGPVLRLTCDPHLVDQTCAALGWPPLRPWGYVVLGSDLAPVAWAQAPAGSHRNRQVYRLGATPPPWLVHGIGLDAPIELRDQAIGSRLRAPRPVTMGGAPVGQITYVSGWGAADAYVLDLFHGPPEGPRATTFAALVPMYDQIFCEIRPSSGGASPFFD